MLFAVVMEGSLLYSLWDNPVPMDLVLYGRSWSVVTLMIFQSLTFCMGLSQFVEDVCLWRPQLLIIDCDDTAFTSIRFRSQHKGYTRLSLKGTRLKNLSFNSSNLPDLKIVDARNTSLSCQKVAPSILEVINYVIVDKKSCFNTICCLKFRLRNEDTGLEETDSNNHFYDKVNTSGPTPLNRPAHLESIEDRTLAKNDTFTSSHSVVHQNVGMKILKNQIPQAISVSTQVKINFDDNTTKKKSEKQTQRESSIETDMTIVYSIIGICSMTSLVSLSLSIYVLYCFYHRRNCSLKDFSMSPRSRSQGTVIL